MLKILFILNGIFFFVGCSSLCDRAPAYGVPCGSMESSVSDALNDPLFEPVDWIPKTWWSIFDDPQLGLLIETTLANNPTIHAACARILEAQYEADRVRASLFPNITWAGDVLREKFSKTGLISPPSTSSPLLSKPFSQTIGAAVPASLGTIPFYFTQYETAFNLTYNFDIWGKNRENLRAACGLVRANIADDIFTRLNLSISVAQVYFQLQTDYQRQKISKEIIQNRQKYVDLIKERIKSNLENNITLNSAEFNLASARQTLLQIQGNIAVNEYQLRAYLAANFDEDIQDLHIDERPLPKVPLPTELPMRLLAHRPDITAQLWTIESAGHQIESAKAGFYPDFNLMSFFGFQTIHFHKWFWGKSTYWAVDPAFTLPIFDGGVLLANLHHSEVNYDLEIFQYNQLILNAVKEVLDGITILRNVHDQFEIFKEEVKNQQQITELTQQRMKAHLNSQLDFLNAERTYLVAKDQEIVTLGNTFQAILSLVKALGGGYDVCCKGNG